ncbi:MAG: ABC transporter substrate-binding protein [Methanoregula sp.]|jgi:hypothetical protein|uniref:ABC transporter substrate-binding protein n=1 Tax=Methanoregula sp. TaxID=2052170 RepID=UPI0025E1F040|nr:ABC transporter substrate-binding protein [Methanoregula sp.]MCK9630657.1 ABC transporter substrate-binding protein [Methanoregula sp.]
MYNELIQTIYISIDDTDTLTGPRGTGKLARMIADTVVKEYPVFGVTRHQLYVHPDIPYTSHNSNAVIHVQAEGEEAMDHLFEMAEEVMLGDFLEGSDPGLAVASSDQIASPLIVYGQDAKCSILTQDRARTLAKNLHIRLKGLGGTEDGVIGCMAGLGLALSKNDGRFLQKGNIRNILSSCTVERLFEEGIDVVCSLDGTEYTTGTVYFRPEKPPRPCPVCGKSVIFVKEETDRLMEDKRD